jgi:Cys-tRNA(Pro)/Cys-tRNA(Cys) deacylase
MTLKAHLAALGIDADLIALERETTTAAMAAEALGVPLEIVVKSILFQARSGELVLVVAPGDRRVDPGKLARATGIDGWRLARPDVVLEATGYPAGGTPPIGLKRPIRTIVDATVAALPVAYAGGGGRDVMLRIRPTDIVRIVGAEIHDVLA